MMRSSYGRRDGHSNTTIIKQKIPFRQSRINITLVSDVTGRRHLRSVKPGFHSNATQAIAFEWKPGFSRQQSFVPHDRLSTFGRRAFFSLVRWPSYNDLRDQTRSIASFFASLKTAIFIKLRIRALEVLRCAMIDVWYWHSRRSFPPQTPKTLPSDTGLLNGFLFSFFH